jgi:hypothetical protein
MTRNPGGRYHKKRRQENAHDVVAFRRGLVRAERPGEPEDAACADWRVTGGTRPGYGASAFIDDLRLRRREGDDSGSCPGEP